MLGGSTSLDVGVQKRSRLRTVIIALMLPMLAACTGSLIDKSKGELAQPGRPGVTVELVSVSVMRPTSGSGDAHLYLCFTRSSTSYPSAKFFQVALPVPYPFPDEAPRGAPFHKIGNSLVLSAGADSDAAPSCGAPSGQQVVRQIAIITAEPGQNVLLPDGMPEAMIVSYHDRRKGLALGYVSRAPILGDDRQISLDLSHSALYTERDGPKPYLLLLTPLTAVTDAVMVVAVGVPLLIGVGVHCWHSTGNCN